MEVNNILSTQLQTWFEVLIVQTEYCCPLAYGCRNPEDGSSRYLQNVDVIPLDYMAPHPRKQYSSESNVCLIIHFTESQYNCIVVPHTVTSQLIYGLRNIIVI
jgi:hypothetical protein